MIGVTDTQNSFRKMQFNVILGCFLVLLTKADDWNIQCPQRLESFEEKVSNSPYVTVVEITSVLKFENNPNLYNVTANVLCSLKGGSIQTPIDIIDIKRDVEDPKSACHTLIQGNSYIVFMEARPENNKYELKDYTEIEYDAENVKLISEINSMPGLEPMEIGGKCPMISVPSSNKTVVEKDESVSEDNSVIDDETNKLSNSGNLEDSVDPNPPKDYEIDNDETDDNRNENINNVAAPILHTVTAMLFFICFSAGVILC